ncbi:MAG: hypothetical protein ACRCSG_00120 [Cellulosilyticaceae bacterium]
MPQILNGQLLPPLLKSITTTVSYGSSSASVNVQCQEGAITQCICIEGGSDGVRPPDEVNDIGVSASNAIGVKAYFTYNINYRDKCNGFTYRRNGSDIKYITADEGFAVMPGVIDAMTWKEDFYEIYNEPINISSVGVRRHVSGTGSSEQGLIADFQIFTLRNYRMNIDCIKVRLF